LIEFTANNDLLIGGDKYTETTKRDFYLMRLNTEREIIWENTYGGSGSDCLTSVAELENGDFLIGGLSESTDGDLESNNGKFDFWLTRIDSNGKILWSQTYGGEGYDYLHSINKISENEFILAGYSDSYLNVAGFYGDDDYRVIKVDGSGNILWEKSYGGSKEDRLLSSVLSKDNGIILFGSSFSTDGDISENIGISDFWVVKIDTDGEIIWEKNFGGSSGEISRKIIKVDDDYLAVGSTYSNDLDVTINNSLDSFRDMWAIKFDEDGNLIWDASFGTEGNDWPHAIVQLDDNSYIIGGHEHAVEDFVITKFRSGSDVTHVSGIENETIIDFQVFPNPSKDFIKIISNEVIFTMKILDSVGKIVYNNEINSNNFNLNANQFGKGIYFVTIFTKNKSTTSKIVIN